MLMIKVKGFSEVANVRRYSLNLAECVKRCRLKSEVSADVTREKCLDESKVLRCYKQ